MRTTVNLDPEAYRLARTLASKRGQTLGEVLGEALLAQFKPAEAPSPLVKIDDAGFPSLSIGRRITSEDVAEFLADE